MKLVMPPAAQARDSLRDVRLVGKPRFTEVHLVVDHAGQQPQARGIDHLFAVLRDQFPGNRGDAAVADAYIRVQPLVLVDQLGVTDQPGICHGLLVSMRAAAREGEMIGHGVVTAGTQGLAAK